MNARIIIVASPKGGVGKTTLALQIAGLLAARGHRVAVLDDDPQGSALAWAALGEALGVIQPFPVLRSRAASLAVDAWVVDTAAGRLPERWLDRADRVVLPVLPDAISHITAQDARAALARRGVMADRLVLVLNRFRPDRAEHRAMAAAPDYADAVVLRDRAAFAVAYGRGRTIANDGHAALARAECALLCARLPLTSQTGALLCTQKPTRR